MASITKYKPWLLHFYSPASNPSSEHSSIRGTKEVLLKARGNGAPVALSMAVNSRLSPRSASPGTLNWASCLEWFKIYNAYSSRNLHLGKHLPCAQLAFQKWSLKWDGWVSLKFPFTLLFPSAQTQGSREALTAWTSFPTTCKTLTSTLKEKNPNIQTGLLKRLTKTMC